MPAPPCASCGKARAALRRPRSGQALCGACFCTAFEAEVLRTVLAGRLLPPGAVVAVGASGGKDSTVLAHVLRALAPRLGLTLHLVAVDEGIGGYRDAALAAVRRQAARWELPLTIVAYADLFGGWTMDAVARSTAGSGRSRSCCTFCGVLRRRALEEGARRVGATHIVTGHNADDMAETVLMNFLRGDAARLARGGGLGSRGEGGALPRCRPLQLASQKEVVLYAHFRRLDYFSEECVYAPEAFRGHARDLLKRLEAARPSVVLDLVHSAERLALAPAARPTAPRCLLPLYFVWRGPKGRRGTRRGPRPPVTAVPPGSGLPVTVNKPELPAPRPPNWGWEGDREPATWDPIAAAPQTWAAEAGGDA
uniref:tRNA(Ile)-lysidine/2-thiocytidine synthase N-terminal domain-containing protein n=1 Tax=Oryctolagus cuniculus TaxID=9986 RepID=A0A5F9DRT8_RABIT